MKQTTKAGALLIWLLMNAGINALDWTQFRGPKSDAVSEESSLPSKLEAKNLIWTAELPGRGLSSAIVVGDRVFVTCASGPKQDRLHVICFNSSDGSKRWERQFWATGRTMTQEKTCVAAPTPASDGERVFALFSSNDLVCLDLDGNLLWLRGLMRDYPNASNSIGMSSSLLAADGVVVAMLENDSQSLSLGINALTGKNAWKLERPKMANWTSPFFVLRSKGNDLVGLQSGKGIVCVEARTGRQVWEYRDGASTIPSTAPSAGILYVPSHGITALQPAIDGEAPKQLWRSAQLRPGTSSPLVLSHKVFVLNDAGVLTCADAANGDRLWQLRLQGPLSATPVAAGSFLYSVNEKGLVQVVDITAPEGSITSELPLNDTVLATPSIAGGAIYIRSDSRLWKIAKR